LYDGLIQDNQQELRVTLRPGVQDMLGTRMFIQDFDGFHLILSLKKVSVYRCTIIDILIMIITTTKEKAFLPCVNINSFFQQAYYAALCSSRSYNVSE
jgi:bifunctional DNase/RNase